VFTVWAAGADIWGTADAFGFVYRPLAGNGQIVARVQSLQNTHGWAKAGVMIRDTLATGAARVLLNLTPHGLELLARTSTGGATTVVANGTGTDGVWLKLVRSGQIVTAYASPDAVRWTTIGTTRVALAANVYVGLAVCSRDTSRLTTATFDNVRVVTAMAQPRWSGPYTAGPRRK
jgi:regulation of enolase protein 1 (concanavalin A-like superfamily)